MAEQMPATPWRSTERVCCCGDVEDEHDDDGECSVDDCGCVGFDWDGEA